MTYRVQVSSTSFTLLKVVGVHRFPLLLPGSQRPKRHSTTPIACWNPSPVVPLLQQLMQSQRRPEPQTSIGPPEHRSLRQTKERLDSHFHIKGVFVCICVQWFGRLKQACFNSTTLLAVGRVSKKLSSDEKQQYFK